MGSDFLLNASGVSKHYPLRGGIFSRKVGSLKAVQDVSFTLMPGETLGLVGESGCGKSTLGRTLMRLEEPTAGRVEFEGKDVLSANGRDLFGLRRSMQMIFQDPYSSLNPRMTVDEIVREPFVIHKLGTRGERRDKVRELLEEVGLSAEMAERYPHEFSGGQRQRIGIARALALQPKLIVADEPVSALDVSVAAQVINLLVRLQKQYGLTYIFISHDLTVVDYISDRIAIMYLGRIVEIGSRDEVFRSPAHPYTRALIASSPVPDPERRDDTAPIRGEIPSPINPPSGCAFHPRCPFAIEACKAAVPALEAVGGASDQERAHQVACIRKDELP